MLNIDLHCHSHVSDGVLSPTDLVNRAVANGVDVLSLTDHDEVGGLEEASAVAASHAIRLIPGVEISVTWADQTVHILGLNIDRGNDALLEGLKRTRKGREERGQRIGEELAEAGIPGAFAGALKFVGNPDLISRTHFARYLVEAGACRDVKDVFNRYMVAGKPGYVPMQWARLPDAIDWIHGAEGRAVIAHPGRYKYSDAEFQAFFGEFRDLGGEGIEVVTGSHTVEQYRKYGAIAREFGFLASRGSDFHGPGESRIDLGKLPPLPATLTPVWHDWGL
jgi:predicted metal-dependent phosphoesterase TrpH